MSASSKKLQGWAGASAAATGGIFFALLILGGTATTAQAAQPCGHDQVCGLLNAEDLVLVGGSHWAIASRLGKDPAAPGGFSLVDLQEHSSRVLTPDVSGPVAPTYAECPGAPVASALVTHGLDLRRRRNGASELFAINHGEARESIEVFDLRTSERGVSLTWKGCVILPSDMSANSVVALPDGMAVTSFGTRDSSSTAEFLAGKVSGFVSRWVTKRGWTHVAGSEFGGDNGIAASADGGTLYINDWSDGTMRVLSLHGKAAPVTIKLGDFHPDNVHALPDGNLLIAGQTGTPRDILSCETGPTCSAGSAIAVVDPATREVKLHWTVAPSATFGAASTALLYDRDYWASSFRGDRIVRLGPEPRQ